MPDSLPTHRDISVHEYLDFFARAYGITQATPAAGSSRRSRSSPTSIGIREKHVNALSKGMKNRVSVARALVHDPPVLIMDEPASGLDPRARIELRELLKVLADQGKAILISSHILTELAEICNGAVIIERGRLLAVGHVDALPRGRGRARPCSCDRAARSRSSTGGCSSSRASQERGSPATRSRWTSTAPRRARATCWPRSSGKGFRIVEFKRERAGLEDVFMTVTRGDVQ